MRASHGTLTLAGGRGGLGLGGLWSWTRKRCTCSCSSRRRRSTNTSCQSCSGQRHCRPCSSTSSPWCCQRRCSMWPPPRTLPCAPVTTSGEVPVAGSRNRLLAHCKVCGSDCACPLHHHSPTSVASSRAKVAPVVHSSSSTSQLAGSWSRHHAAWLAVAASGAAVGCGLLGWGMGKNRRSVRQNAKPTLMCRRYSCVASP